MIKPTQKDLLDMLMLMDPEEVKKAYPIVVHAMQAKMQTNQDAFK